MVAALIVAVLALLPALDRTSNTSTLEPLDSTTSVPAPPLTESRPPFGRPVAGALAYLGTDRIIHLIDLTTGESLGSRGVDADRRPAAVSRTHAFIGRLPALDIGGSRNWDELRRFPWAGGSYLDIGPGTSLSYSLELDKVAATVTGLSGAVSGVVVFGPDAATADGPRSDGRWSFATWVGNDILVREQVGTRTMWWLVEGGDPSSFAPASLPDGFLPIDGTDGLVFGRLNDAGVIVHLDDGAVHRLPGKWSWGADWRPTRPPILATVAESEAGAPAILIGYTPEGAFAWSVPLESPVTAFSGGVGWSPDGSTVAAATGSTIQIVSAAGQIIGNLDPALPRPQTAPGAAFLQIVP